MASDLVHFANRADLSRLPYFELEEGRLRLADPSFGPSIDCHTHLALSYVLPGRVDLKREWPETEHYLAKGRPLDFEVYVNRNFTKPDLARMERDLALGSLTAGGMRRTHTLPNLLREMKELGITQSALLPIDLPVLSENARDWLVASKGERAIVCFGSVHPFARDPMGKLDRQVALGARGIKVHPAVQMVRPDGERAMALYRACGERKLPVLFHCGPVDIETRLGRRLSQVRLYERAIAETPETVFVLGHSGALQMPEALAFAKRYPNVWLELSSQSLTNVRRILDEAPPERLVHGSDWPFYHQAISLAKILLATEAHPDARRRVLYGNAARLFGLPEVPATA